MGSWKDLENLQHFCKMLEFVPERLKIKVAKFYAKYYRSPYSHKYLESIGS